MSAQTCCPVVELRQYTLVPDGREELISLFEREFIETQEATGMIVIGQFRDLNNPDRFVWLRGYHHLCKITEVSPQKKIAYTWRYKGEVGESLVTIELSPDGDKTRLKLTHKGLETFPKTPAYARKNFEAGWTAIIGSELKQFLERSKGKP